MKEQVYEALTRKSLDGFFIADSAGRILDVNDTLCKMLAYTHEELLCLNLTDIETPGAPDQSATCSLAVMEVGSDRFYSQYRRKDGAVLDVEISAQYVKDPDGCFFVFIRDITERRRAEKMLRDSEECLHLAMRATNIGFWDWDVEQNRLTWDTSMYTLYGVQEGDFGGAYDAWACSIHPEDQDYAETEIQAALRGEREYAPEFRIVLPDGTIRFIKAASQTFFDGNGKPFRMIGTNLDITERTLAEKALKDSEFFFKESQRAASIGSYSADFIAGHWDSSDVLDTIFGIDKNYNRSIQGWLDIVHPEDRDMLDRYLREEVVTNRTQFSKEYRIVRNNDGETRWVNGLGEVRFDDNGNAISMIGTIQDITERKLFENELQNKNSELESFTYTVSHDLKSPLITIQTFAGMIKQDLETGNHARATKDLVRIEDAATKMTLLLNDLLELSRVGKVINPLSPIDMNSLVKDTLTLLAGTVDPNQVEIVVQPDLPVVMGDQKRIAGVFQNLIENAVKYMGEQSAPRVEIGTRNGGKEHVFFVRDNGQGIDLRFQKNIFGLFNKLDAGSRGTGIGLALVKRIIEVHGGRVWVESEGVNKGSTFCFTIKMQ